MVVMSLLFFAFNMLFCFLAFSIPYWVQSPDPQHATLVQWIALGAALFVTGMQIFHTVMLVIRKYAPVSKLTNSRFLEWYFLAANVKYEAKLKRSALFKVDCMLCNAHDVHRDVIRYKEQRRTSEFDDSSFLSNFGMAINEYSKRENMMTYCGGVNMAWRRMYNGTLFTEEGIWFSGRLVAGSAFQVIVIFALPIVVSILMPVVLEQIRNGWTQDSEQPVDEESMDDTTAKTQIAVGIGTAFAFLVAVGSTYLYLPSVVATTMKFRRGVLPSLRSEDLLHRYRFALDQTTLVLGGMFWGLMISSLVVGILAGGFAYLLMWETTQRFILGVVGNLFGLCVILVVKIFVMQVIRFTHYAAFYRKKPLSANVISICLECYSIGISIWFMMVRAIKIVIISALYLGRTDTPLFASGVGIFGPLEIDNWPTVTRKEILIHEAHRHPYIETLGYLYMMQLRYRDGFANRANSAWRLVFVLALMPWLHKYRDITRPEHFGTSKKNRSEGFASLEMQMQEDVVMDLISIGEPSPTNTGPGSNRLMRQSMVSARWQTSMDTTRSSSIVQSNNAEVLGDKARIANLKREIARLQSELTSLEEANEH